MIKAILFDLDETLMDRSTSIKRFLQAQYTRFSPALNAINVDLYSSRFIDIESHGLVWKDEVYQALVSEFKIQDLTWEQLVEDYVTNLHKSCVLFDGVIFALEIFKKEGYSLGLITNGLYEVQWPNIQALGLTPFFSSILISETEGIKKPDAAIFHRGVSQLKVNCDEAIFIGDHPISDMRGAKNAGLKTIWKRNAIWQDECKEADAQFDDFEALPMIVRNL